MTQALKGGNFGEIKKYLDLVAAECENEGKKKDVCALSFLFKGMISLGRARSLKEIKFAATYLRKAQRIALALEYQKDPEARDLILLVESVLSVAKTYYKLLKMRAPARRDLSPKVLEECLNNLQFLKEKMPEFAEVADHLELQLQIALNQAKAIKEYWKGDTVSAKVYIEEMVRYLSLSSEKSSPEYRDFLTALINFTYGFSKLMEAMHCMREEKLLCPACDSKLGICFFTNATASNKVEMLKKLLEESKHLFEKSLSGARAIDPKVVPEAETLATRAESYGKACDGFKSCAKAYQALLVGRPLKARREFKSALEKLNDAGQVIAKGGEFNQYFLRTLNSWQTRTRNWITSIQLESKKQIAVSAGKQFGTFFVLFLLFFIVLDIYNILSAPLETKISVSMSVSLITAFGTKAIKLKDLIEI